MEAIGIRVDFHTAQWPENLKAARAGKLMMWALGCSAAAPDGSAALARYDGRQVGGQNLARFKLPEFDALYERHAVAARRPRAPGAVRRGQALAVAYMPYKYRVTASSPT